MANSPRIGKLKEIWEIYGEMITINSGNNWILPTNVVFTVSCNSWGNSGSY